MQKKFVKVIVEVNELGEKKPLTVIYNDEAFEVDRVLDMRPAVSLKVGGIGERYKVRIRGFETNLFCERDKWFVEEKNNG